MNVERLAGAVRHRPRGAARASPASWSTRSRKLAHVDWKARGLEGFGKPEGFHERQVDRWLAHLAGFKFRDIPGLDEAAAWLRGPQAARRTRRASSTATTSSPT